MNENKNASRNQTTSVDPRYIIIGLLWYNRTDKILSLELMRMNEFDKYIGLGDSISGDHYPGKGRGFTSLLYRNHSDYSEFNGKDIVTSFPDCLLHNLTIDGNTSANLFRMLPRQLTNINDEGDVLVTLTIGGNDLIQGLVNSYQPMEQTIQKAEENILKIIELLQKKYRNLSIIIGTIYDPTEYITSLSPLFPAQDIILDLNNRIVKVGDESQIAVADVYKHFSTHGSIAWHIFPYEPSALGASEIRRVFWDALSNLK